MMRERRRSILVVFSASAGMGGGEPPEAGAPGLVSLDLPGERGGARARSCGALLLGDGVCYGGRVPYLEINETAEWV